MHIPYSISLFGNLLIPFFINCLVYVDYQIDPGISLCYSSEPGCRFGHGRNNSGKGSDRGQYYSDPGGKRFHYIYRGFIK